MEVKARKVGSSMTIPIPSNIKVQPGEKFEASIDSKGNLLFKKVKR